MATFLSYGLIVLVLCLWGLALVGLLRPVMTLIFYNSVPLLAGISLVLIAPLCIFGAREVLGNVFLIHTLWQMAALTAMSALASTLVIAEYRTVIINSDRFAELDRELTQLIAHHPRFWQFAASGILPFVLGLIVALPSPVLAWWYSAKSAESPVWIELMGGFVLGLGAYGLFGLFLTWMESRWFWRESQLTLVFPLDHRLKRPLPVTTLPAGSRISWRWWPDLTGYFQDQYSWTLRPGHLQLTLAMVVMVVAYLIMIFTGTKSGEAPGDSGLPTSFFLVFLISALSLILSALAFFLDLYRVPMMLVVVGYLLLLYNISQNVTFLDEIIGQNRDHVFEVIGPEEATLNARNVGRPVICDLRKRRKKVVVVTAPGGGIHAAAWTAQVLSGLKAHNKKFSTSLIGISATSGGSVGTMYFLRDLETQKLEAAQHAQASCLEAVAWGLGGPDLLRILSPLGTPDWDRGRVLEQRWENLMGVNRKENRLTLRGWEKGASEGTLPAVAFNATEVETGRRVVFSTARIKGAPNLPDQGQPLDVLTKFPQADIDVATAVRLSASFPYVSPAAKARGLQLEDLWHVVDGGYVDNEGIMTALGWISELAKEDINKVIFIRIHHGDAAPAEPVNPKAPDFFHSPFFNVFLGPENAMMQVRATSQLERGELESDLLANINQQKVVIQIVKFRGDGNEWTKPPLSWTLSGKQKAQYQKAWDRLIAAGELAVLDKELQ